MTGIQTEESNGVEAEKEKRKGKIHASVIRYAKTVFNAAAALSTILTALRQRDLER